MSYCVHCGVELDRTAKKCPLCETPVYDPKALPDPEAVPPYPVEKGAVELPKRDIGILIFSLMLATSVTCVLLNVLVYNGNPWSAAVVGACVLVLVFFLPLFFPKPLPVYLYLLFDGMAVLLYLAVLGANMASGNGWVLHLGLPIVVLTLLAGEVLALCVNIFNFHFLSGTIEIMSVIGVYTLLLEVIIDLYATNAIHVSWSAVVLTVCVVVDVVAITILCSKRLRNNLRKRLHL